MSSVQWKHSLTNYWGAFSPIAPMNVSVRWRIVPWGVREWDSGTCRENIPVARMAQGVPCARLSVSRCPLWLPWHQWCHTDCPYKPTTAALPSHLLCSAAQHPAPRTESETKAASKGCSVLAAGLPAKQAVLLKPSGTTVSTSSNDSPFAAPERLVSVLAANAEAGLSSEQTDESGSPEGSVGCRATKAARRLSLEALPHYQ